MGAGRMVGTTQYTVNNQMCNATLMNIADNPTNVQLPGVYKTEEIPRVPIICTGNDFSTLYAPLIRDGRMVKFYWNPSREDRIGVATGIFREDNVGEACIERIVDEFPGQSIDFFGALRARLRRHGQGLLRQHRHREPRQAPRELQGRRCQLRKPQHVPGQPARVRQLLVGEQENVKRVQLADSYLDGAELAGVGGSSMPEKIKGE